MSRDAEQTGPQPRRLVGPVFALAACALVWGSLLTFDAGDWPSPHQYPHNDPTANACGRVGAWVAYNLFYYVGDGAYVAALFALCAAVTRLVRGRIESPIQRAIGLALLVSCVAASVHLVAGRGAGALPEGCGGVLGMALGEFISTNLSGLGAVLVLGYALLVGLLFAAEGWVWRLPGALQRLGRASGTALATARTAAVAVAGAHAVSGGASSGGASGGGSDPGPPVAVVPRPRPEPKINANRPAPTAGKDVEDDPTLFDDADGQAADATEPPDGQVGDAAQTDEAPVGANAAPADGDDGAGSKPVSPLIIKHFERQAPAPPTEPYPRELEDWIFPSPSLLEDPEYTFSAQQESIVRAKAKVLERTLEEFRLDAHVVEIDTGPVITMFELSLAPGIKVSQIATLSNDIARALKAPAVRVVAPLPGKNTVGIEVPNIDKETVRLKELMSMVGRKAREMALPLYIGKDASGSALVGDLTKMPHLLIAGTTGSGKSVCINSIIVSLLMTQRPDWCKLILVDPKMVEMSNFKDVPHLMCPIVTDMKRAESILEWAVTKMEERYELFSEARVRDIKAYNALDKEEIYERFAPATDEERHQIPTHLPYVVIIIDELADLMMTSAKEVEHYLSRLAQKSRAVGVHIVVATQRPEARVVTGLIKSNLPCRIAFRVASRMDSRIVLDQNGAEVLMGQGDMLFLPPGSSKLIRSQGTFVEERELRAVIDFLKERSEPEFHPELIRMKSGDGGESGERDPLFDQAVRIILETKRGSVSLLQRRLTIGYSRASRLIDQMAEAGIVGVYKGSQAREVHMTLEEWDVLQQQVAADVAEGYAADRDDDEEEAVIAGTPDGDATP
ncbi:MAG TPA: DNA translocase FtsK 4TM domain-containing protein [Phycisphaerae bacterium]|nr:DNA translocase FtsK 4TM domain-containing protein [Phycisphaerae bacterium]